MGDTMPVIVTCPYITLSTEMAPLINTRRKLEACEGFISVFRGNYTAPAQPLSFLCKTYIVLV